MTVGPEQSRWNPVDPKNEFLCKPVEEREIVVNDIRPASVFNVDGSGGMHIWNVPAAQNATTSLIHVTPNGASPMMWSEEYRRPSYSVSPDGKEVVIRYRDPSDQAKATLVTVGGTQEYAVINLGVLIEKAELETSRVDIRAIGNHQVCVFEVRSGRMVFLNADPAARADSGRGRIREVHTDDRFAQGLLVGAASTDTTNFVAVISNKNGDGEFQGRVLIEEEMDSVKGLYSSVSVVGAFPATSFSEVVFSKNGNCFAVYNLGTELSEQGTMKPKVVPVYTADNDFFVPSAEIKLDGACSVKAAAVNANGSIVSVATSELRNSQYARPGDTRLRVFSMVEREENGEPLMILDRYIRGTALCMQFETEKNLLLGISQPPSGYLARIAL